MKKVLIMSDTHGDKRLYKKILDKENPDISIHAGDFCCDFDDIKKYFDYIVLGNNDFDGPEILDFKIEGLSIRLMHGHQFPNFLGNQLKRNEYLLNYAKDSKLDILITGHTHIEYLNFEDNILVLNPGSLIMPRNTFLKPSYAIINIDNGKILNTTFEQVIKYI